jgi:hypothetical protein
LRQLFIKIWEAFFASNLLRGKSQKKVSKNFSTDEIFFRAICHSDLKIQKWRDGFKRRLAIHSI